MSVNWKLKQSSLLPRRIVGLEGPMNITESPDDFQLASKVGDVNLDYARIPSFNVSCGPASVVVLRRNPSRLVATIINDSANTIYLSFSELATMNAGVRLNANGGSIVFGLATDIPYTGSIAAIAVGASNVLVTEV